MINMAPLSRRQEQILNYMWTYFLANDMLPPTTEMRRHFGWKRNNSCNEIRSLLESRGYLERNTVQKYKFTAMFHAERRASHAYES